MEDISLTVVGEILARKILLADFVTSEEPLVLYPIGCISVTGHRHGDGVCGIRYAELTVCDGVV